MDPIGSLKEALLSYGLNKNKLDELNQDERKILLKALRAINNNKTIKLNDVEKGHIASIKKKLNPSNPYTYPKVDEKPSFVKAILNKFWTRTGSKVILKEYQQFKPKTNAEKREDALQHLEKSLIAYKNELTKKNPKPFEYLKEDVYETFKLKLSGSGQREKNDEIMKKLDEFKSIKAETDLLNLLQKLKELRKICESEIKAIQSHA